MAVEAQSSTLVWELASFFVIDVLPSDKSCQVAAVVVVSNNLKV